MKIIVTPPSLAILFLDIAITTIIIIINNSSSSKIRRRNIRGFGLFFKMKIIVVVGGGLLNCDTSLKTDTGLSCSLSSLLSHSRFLSVITSFSFILPCFRAREILASNEARFSWQGESLTAHFKEAGNAAELLMLNLGNLFVPLIPLDFSIILETG
uniref:Uncharacterized protein n=1 Tax=Rhizophora mucronata TaxID=61149 RepID=A0A2P2J581_RHIMU